MSSNNQTATATFEDGTSETADLLIGAEGAHSIVREYLVGPEKAALQPSPLVASATMARLPKAAAEKFKELAQRFLITVHPSGHFFWIGGQRGHWSKW